MDGTLKIDHVQVGKTQNQYFLNRHQKYFDANFLSYFLILPTGKFHFLQFQRVLRPYLKKSLTSSLQKDRVCFSVVRLLHQSGGRYWTYLLVCQDTRPHWASAFYRAGGKLRAGQALAGLPRDFLNGVPWQCQKLNPFQNNF